MKLSTLKDWAKAQAARTIWAYGPDELVTRLRKIGVTPGSTLMFHSSWRPHNGFQGKPADVVRALNTLGASPQDLLAILQAIKAAGALNAELEVI